MPHKKKPGIAVIISIGKKPKPDMKKYVGDAMPNAMNKAWKVLKIQDWRADNPFNPNPNNPIPNTPEWWKQYNQSNQVGLAPNQPPPPNMDPSWTPEAIARVNAQNDEARRALRGGQP